MRNITDQVLDGKKPHRFGTNYPRPVNTKRLNLFQHISQDARTQKAASNNFKDICGMNRGMINH